MWENGRFKKLVISLLAVMLLWSSTLFQVLEVKAVNPIVVGTVGKKLLRGIAEKTGTQLSKKQLQNVTDTLNKRSLDGDQKAIDFITKANGVTGTTSATKPSWKDYVIDTATLISGADLLFDILDIFEGAFDSSTPVQMYGVRGDGCGATVEYRQVGNSLELWSHYHGKGTLIDPKSVKFMTYSTKPLAVTVSFVQARNVNTYYTAFDYKITYTTDSGTYVQTVEAYFDSMSWSYNPCALDNTTYPYTVTNNDIVNNYDNDIKTIFDNDTYTTNNTTNNFTIMMPDDDSPDIVDYDNDKLTEIEIEIINPPPPVVVVPPGDDVDIPITDDPDNAVVVYDRTLIGYIKSVYEYLADGIDNSISALKDIVDSAEGLVAFLDESFEWLPNEWRAMFGSAFVLGVVAHFLRR